MNFMKIGAVAFTLASVAIAGCASDAGEEIGTDTAAVVSGPVAAGRCLRVDPRAVQTHVNVRTSPDIPEARWGEAENIRAKLPPNTAVIVRTGQAVSGADPRENGWWYLVDFRLADGTFSEGWVKGQFLETAGPDCDEIWNEPSPSEIILSEGMCIRLLDGDSQARGLVLRSSPAIEDGFPANRIGLLGPRGAARYLGHADAGDRDWYLVNIRDARDGLLKQGYVSGRGNFTLASEWECGELP